MPTPKEIQDYLDKMVEEMHKTSGLTGLSGWIPRPNIAPPNDPGLDFLREPQTDAYAISVYPGRKVEKKEITCSAPACGKKNDVGVKCCYWCGGSFERAK